MQTFDERLAALAEQFPTLHGANGLKPFRADMLLEYANKNGGSGMRHAAAFIANIYNHKNGFNLGAAVSTWDAEHRAAFAAWAVDPFWR